MYLKDKRELQFARGSIAYVVDNDIRCMYCEALQRDGGDMYFLGMVCKCIENLCATSYEDVLYVTDHHQSWGKIWRFLSVIYYIISRKKGCEEEKRMAEIQLLPGVPDDSNREYLPKNKAYRDCSE